MRSPILTQYFDPQSVLSELDLYQIENMIWLRLAPHKERINGIRFSVSRRGNEEFTWDHSIDVTVELASGKSCTFQTVKVTKAAALMDSIRQLEDGVVKRIRFEDGTIYRYLRKLSSRTEAVLELAANQFSTPPALSRK